MNLELSLKQTLKLTPQMLQSMEVLQMSTQELADYIQDLVQTNPAAELTEPTAQGDESEELWPTRTIRTGSISRPTGRSWTLWPGWAPTAD